MKALIFDAGPLINLSMNGLLYVLPGLKAKFDGKFIITAAVKREVIDRPINVQRFELGALQIQNLLESGVLELPSAFGIDDADIREETAALLDQANHYFQTHGKWIPIVSEAEMSCLALTDELARKDIQSLIVIDERTARLLAEKPQNLERLMSEKLHQRVSLVAEDFSIFAKYRFIRSPELIFVAHKKGVLNIPGKKALEAALYATKYKGAAISLEEIDVLKKL